MFAVSLSLYFLAILQVICKIYFWHSYLWLIYIRDRSWVIRTFIFQFNKGFSDIFSLGGWGGPEKDWIVTVLNRTWDRWWGWPWLT